MPKSKKSFTEKKMRAEKEPLYQEVNPYTGEKIKYNEDAPANATGPAAPGTGDDSSTVVVRKKTKKKDWMKTGLGRKILSKINEIKTYEEIKPEKTKFQKIKELMYSYRGIGQYGLGTYVPTTSHQQKSDNPDEKPTAKSHIKKPKRKGRK